MRATPPSYLVGFRFCVCVVVRHASHTHTCLFRVAAVPHHRNPLVGVRFRLHRCPIRPASNRGHLVLAQGAREAVRYRGGGVSERGREAAATGVGALARGGGAPCGDDDREIGGAGVL